MFYFSLANIAPQFCSKLATIQLVAICRIKYGADKLLEDFVTTVNALQCRGIRFKIGTSELLVHGTLVMAPCDTLAAQFKRGFKGVGFAVKPCRTCEITKSEVKHSYFLGSAERTLEKHNERIKNLEEVSKRRKVY